MQRRAQPPAWNEIAGNFAWDGGMLVDLYVRRPTPGAWGGLIRTIRTWDYPARYWANGESEPLPFGYEPIAAAHRAEANPRLEMRVGTVALIGLFFDDEEVELSLNRSEVHGEIEFARLCEFMTRFGDEIGRPVVLTPENAPTNPFLIYNPADRSWSFVEWRASVHAKPEEEASQTSLADRLRSLLRALRLAR